MRVTAHRTKGPMHGLAARAEALCRAVAPELADWPLYVLLRSQLPPELRGNDRTLACTMRYLDLIVRPTLEWLGRWRGRGPAMPVHPQKAPSASAHRPREGRRRSFLPSFLAVALHELAHTLDIRLPGETEPSPGLIAFGRRILAAETTGELPPSNGDSAPIPWRWHEWRFIRIAIHLAHRATHAGVQLAPPATFDAAAHGLSPTWKYATALGDEPKRMVMLDFAAIRSAPAPAAFAAVWRRDVVCWLLPAKSREQPSETLAACGRGIFAPKRKARMPC